MRGLSIGGKVAFPHFFLGPNGSSVRAHFAPADVPACCGGAVGHAGANAREAPLHLSAAHDSGARWGSPANCNHGTGRSGWAAADPVSPDALWSSRQAIREDADDAKGTHAGWLHPGDSE